MAPMERHFARYSEDRAFSGSFTAGYKLPGIVAASYWSFSHTALAFAFVVFRILSVTCSLTRALSQSLAHAQQLFSASTPGQVLAPRVCTLVLVLRSVVETVNNIFFKQP